MKYRVLELFAGIGGFSIGLERTGAFETVAFCEIDNNAQRVLNKNWPGVKVYSDVREITYEKLKADGNVPDVITGGFPCQDISLAGKGEGLAGARSGLWFEFARIIKEVRPRWVIAENVSALRSRGLDQVLRSLAEIGYDAEWHCIPASAVGAPHRRDRIWIVAYPHRTDCWVRSVAREVGNEGWGASKTGRTSVQPRYREARSGDVEPRSEDVAYSSDEGVDRRIGVEGHNAEELGQRGCYPGGGLRDERFEAISNSNASGYAPHQHDADSKREAIVTEWQLKSFLELGGRSWWAVEPPVGRVANGIPGRTHRLKQLGNAVVPQIPELIGRAIASTKIIPN